MKRFLMLIITAFALSFFTVQDADAQKYTFRTYQFAYKQKKYGKWMKWSDWERSDMRVTVNMEDKIVRIYSPETQTYIITDYIKDYKDKEGGTQVKLQVVDQDGDHGSMRIRFDRNDKMQIYIDFANVKWVYNVVETE
ncbi:MAG: hypothetical protein K5764_02405 [Prevotella sp.]|nr:hypothetical protein [Prevotella sp.]